ncbi:rRNA methyltransferase 2, mitochondrial [Hylaeus anthracinus]|uniref:rRNA methyltransferase 2, mitochondrial n=1 Tax=Hylaeus anthracinus TaxID=313031 RepID=UPI0023B9951E|nr:rRNA methyltransferase 2, mitochondrial [Hylaeus anthracinus]
MKRIGNFLFVRNLYTCNTLFRETPENLKGKKHSSQLWLTRQLQDPYVEKAKQLNYRCRSAFKLLEINDRFKILKPGQVVIDCGAAPGSWTQVAVNLTNANAKTDNPVGTVLGIDKLPVFPVEGATLLCPLDFTHAESQKRIMELLEGNKADVVLSDMAPNASGVRDCDHENIIKLAYSAFVFALQVTQVDGTFLCKVWDGGMSKKLEQDILKFYKTVKIVRPQATRDESTEKFLLGRGFKGIKATSDSKV